MRCFVPNFLPDIKAEDTPNGRLYVTPAGNFPSVTTVLSGSADDEWLKVWRERIGEEKAAEITRQAGLKGTGLHTLCECLILGNPAPDGIPGHSKIMFSFLKPLILKHLEAYCGVEVGLYSAELKMAGRTDLIGFWKGKLSVIDYKSNHSDKNKKTEDIEDYFIQICAYSIMWNELMKTHEGPTIKQGVILMASKYGRQIWEFNPYDYEEKLRERIRLYYELKGGENAN